MDLLYYTVENGVQKGPFTIENLSTQNLTPDTLVWRQGLSEWQKASSFPELAPLLALSTPPEESAFGQYAEMPPSDPYFAMMGEKQVGPMSVDELISMGITRDTPVWRNGMRDWMPAFTQPEIMTVLNSANAPNHHNIRSERTAPEYFNTNTTSTNRKNVPAGTGHINWLPWAIAGTVICIINCISIIGAIFGIIGINQANKANEYYRRNDNIRADSANNNAKVMTIICLAIAGIGLATSFFSSIFNMGIYPSAGIFRMSGFPFL